VAIRAPCAAHGRRSHRFESDGSRTAGDLNAGAIAALLVALPFALANWWSRLRHDRRIEYVSKPATLATLVALAVTLDPAPGAGDRRWWFVAALVFSLAGDIALMLPGDRFVAGLGAFLVAHLCYVAGFATDLPPAPALLLAAAVVVVAIVPLAVRVLGALRGAAGRAALAGPVGAYIAVIAAMVTTALASGNPAAGAGAALFAGSDSLIAWDRFVHPLRWAPVVIMVTYHVGQTVLVFSLLA
jgi:uncharacterized membrane protein YhhN